MKLKTIFILSILTTFQLNAQDTFSIVAVDPETGEVGSAGASCLDLNQFILPADFIGELFPGVGAINTQAFYSITNQRNAAQQMEMGDTPEEIIRWLEANDVDGSAVFRQYGVAKIIDGNPFAAAFTGQRTSEWKGHRVGDNYAIQGNILLGPEILDCMEINFLNTEGSLAEKLMAALQGANVPGADARCIDNGVSSLFAFLKVAQPDDPKGDPSLRIGVIFGAETENEPIDSLQRLFDLQMNPTGVQSEESGTINIFPNPVNSLLTIKAGNIKELILFDVTGRKVLSEQFRNHFGDIELDVSLLSSGVYLLTLKDKGGEYRQKKFIKL